METKDWRLKIGKKRNPLEYHWKFDIQTEYVKFAEIVNDIAEIYDWNFWGGGAGNYAVTLSQGIRNGINLSIRMNPSDNYYYYASFAKEWNPNNVTNDTYNECIGKTMEEALNYIKQFLKENFYIREFKDARTCVMGGAYDRYLLEKKWADEEIENYKNSI